MLKLDKYNITVFLRKPEQAQVLEQIGVKSVLGDRTDLKLIEEIAGQYDVRAKYVLPCRLVLELIIIYTDRHQLAEFRVS